MTQFDSESGTGTEGDSEVVEGMRGATRLVERYGLELRLALAFLLMATLGFAVRMAFENQLGDNMGAMLVWFSLILATGVTILGGSIKLWGAIKKRRHDWE